MMSEPPGHTAHGSAMDQADWDSVFDLQERQAVTMLKHDYDELFSPAAPMQHGPMEHGTSANVGSADMDGMEAEMTALATLMRQTLSLTDAAMPRLRRASTRDLARRVREPHATLVRKVGSSMSH